MHVGPRYLVKFISSTFMPLDRDIVREMWVLGDLKRQLGIKSRRQQKQEKKAAKVSMKDLESSAMYENRDRSFSSNSSTNQPPGYEAALTHSPGNASMRSAHGISPQTLGAGYHTKASSSWRDDNSSTGYDGISYVVEGEPESLHAAGASPANYPGSFPNRPSPDPSYYSVSDLPVPSPIPSPQYYRYSGEDGVISYPSAPSHSTPPRATLAPPSRTAGGQRSPNRSPDSYEMQVRSSPAPPSPPGPRVPPPSAFPSNMNNDGRVSPYQRAGSQASGVSYYATASEHWTDDDDDAETINNDHRDDQTHRDQLRPEAASRRESNISFTPRAI